MRTVSCFSACFVLLLSTLIADNPAAGVSLLNVVHGCRYSSGLELCQNAQVSGFRSQYFKKNRVKANACLHLKTAGQIWARKSVIWVPVSFLRCSLSQCSLSSSFPFVCLTILLLLRQKLFALCSFFLGGILSWVVSHAYFPHLSSFDKMSFYNVAYVTSNGNLHPNIFS